MLKGWAFCSFIVITAACFAARPERNAFVDYRVVSVIDLEQQIKTDPAVADRYERHFGMTKGQLLSFVATLHRSRLANDRTFTVYSVPVDGHVKMHMQRFKEGEPIFADAGGNPILLVRCGNPLTLGPEEANAVSLPSVDVSPADTPDESLKIAAAPGLYAGNSAPPDMLITTPTPSGDTTYTPETPETLTSPGEGPASAPQSFGGTGGSGPGGGGYLPYIPILGGIIYGIGSSGGNHPLSTPEPLSFIPLGFGLVGVMIRRSKKRS
jgi:hypothetical protein